VLPEALDPSTLRAVAVGAVVVAAVLALLVLRFVRKMVVRVVLLGALAGVGIYAWSQREALEDCRADCACSFAGFDVQVPGCPDP
jgi:hypothetical protein